MESMQVKFLLQALFLFAATNLFADEGRLVGLPAQTKFGAKVDNLIAILWLGGLVFIIIGPQIPFFKRRRLEYYSLSKEEQRRHTIIANRKWDPIIIVSALLGIVAGEIIGSPLLTFSAFIVLLMGLILAISIINLTRSGGSVSQDIPKEHAISIEDLSKRFRGRLTHIALEQEMNLHLLVAPCSVCGREVHASIVKPYSLRTMVFISPTAWVNSWTREVQGDECGHILVPARMTKSQAWRRYLLVVSIPLALILFFLFYGVHTGK